jgi:hypothetical protein
LQPQLPSGLWASVEEAVTIDDPESGPGRRLHPDVHVSEVWEPAAAYAAAPSGRDTAQPLVLVDPEPRPDRHVQIVEAGGRVVTAVEVLSATNKLESDRRLAYRRKQRAYLAGGVNLVEIDLIRDGEYIVLASKELIPLSRRAPYMVSVWRADQPQVKFAYPCPLRQPLPRVAVPLRVGDADAVLDLQELIEVCYDRGRYHARLDYRAEPEPPLADPDAAWADELLHAAGLR